MTRGEAIAIDLISVRSSSQLLALLGEALHLGGPGGNIECAGANAGKGWGRNWDALSDSLGYLDSGGIWGTSRVFHFPLLIEFTNSMDYRDADTDGFATFSAILETAKKAYRKNYLQLEYVFK